MTTTDVPDFTPDPAFTAPAPEAFTPAAADDLDKPKPANPQPKRTDKYKPYVW